MRNQEAKKLVIQAYDDVIDSLAGNGRAERLHGYERAVRHRSKYESCGRVLISPCGNEIKHWCRRPVCPTCATYWGRKLGRALVSACRNDDPDDYRMVTLILDVVSMPDDGFDRLKTLRRSIGNALDYRRRAVGVDQAGWRAFGLAGTLELDCFEADDFAHLGSDKRAQYRALGYVPERAHGSQWVATVHAVVHVGTLGRDAVRTFFENVAPVVHVQGLHDDKNLVDNAERIVGYAAKVRFTTTLANGVTRLWSPEAVTGYVDATMRCSHGRQGFKFAIHPKKERKKKDYIRRNNSSFLEPMPVVIG